jgi:hypothetical protein
VILSTTFPVTVPAPARVTRTFAVAPTATCTGAVVTGAYRSARPSKCRSATSARAMPGSTPIVYRPPWPSHASTRCRVNAKENPPGVVPGSRPYGGSTNSYPCSTQTSSTGRRVAASVTVTSSRLGAGSRRSIPERPREPTATTFAPVQDRPRGSSRRTCRRRARRAPCTARDAPSPSTCPARPCRPGRRPRRRGGSAPTEVSADGAPVEVVTRPRRARPPPGRRSHGWRRYRRAR